MMSVVDVLLTIFSQLWDQINPIKVGQHTLYQQNTKLCFCNQKTWLFAQKGNPLPLHVGVVPALPVTSVGLPARQPAAAAPGEADQASTSTSTPFPGAQEGTCAAPSAGCSHTGSHQPRPSAAAVPPVNNSKQNKKWHKTIYQIWLMKRSYANQFSLLIKMRLWECVNSMF